MPPKPDGQGDRTNNRNSKKPRVGNSPARSNSNSNSAASAYLPPAPKHARLNSSLSSHSSNLNLSASNVEAGAEGVPAPAVVEVAVGSPQRILNGYQVLAQGPTHKHFGKTYYILCVLWLLDGLSHDQIYGVDLKFARELVLFFSNKLKEAGYAKEAIAYKELFNISHGIYGDAKAKKIAKILLDDLNVTLGIEFERAEGLYTGPEIDAFLSKIPRGTLIIDSIKGDNWSHHFNKYKFFVGLNAGTAGDPGTSTPEGIARKIGGSVLRCNDPFNSVQYACQPFAISSTMKIYGKSLKEYDIVEKNYEIEEGSVVARFDQTGVTIRNMQKLTEFIKSGGKKNRDTYEVAIGETCTIRNKDRSYTATFPKALWSNKPKCVLVLSGKTDGDFGVGRVQANISDPHVYVNEGPDGAPILNVAKKPIQIADDSFTYIHLSLDLLSNRISSTFSDANTILMGDLSAQLSRPMGSLKPSQEQIDALKAHISRIRPEEIHGQVTEYGTVESRNRARIRNEILSLLSYLENENDTFNLYMFIRDFLYSTTKFLDNNIIRTLHKKLETIGLRNFVIKKNSTKLPKEPVKYSEDDKVEINRLVEKTKAQINTKKVRAIVNKFIPLAQVKSTTTLRILFSDHGKDIYRNAEEQAIAYNEHVINSSPFFTQQVPLIVVFKKLLLEVYNASAKMEIGQKLRYSQSFYNPIVDELSFAPLSKIYNNRASYNAALYGEGDSQLKDNIESLSKKLATVDLKEIKGPDSFVMFINKVKKLFIDLFNVSDDTAIQAAAYFAFILYNDKLPIYLGKEKKRNEEELSEEDLSEDEDDEDEDDDDDDEDEDDDEDDAKISIIAFELFKFISQGNRDNKYLWSMVVLYLTDYVDEGLTGPSHELDEDFAPPAAAAAAPASDAVAPASASSSSSYGAAAAPNDKPAHIQFIKGTAEFIHTYSKSDPNFQARQRVRQEYIKNRPRDLIIATDADGDCLYRARVLLDTQDPSNLIKNSSEIQSYRQQVYKGIKKDIENDTAIHGLTLKQRLGKYIYDNPEDILNPGHWGSGAEAAYLDLNVVNENATLLYPHLSRRHAVLFHPYNKDGIGGSHFDLILLDYFPASGAGANAGGRRKTRNKRTKRTKRTKRLTRKL